MFVSASSKQKMYCLQQNESNTVHSTHLWEMSHSKTGFTAIFQPMYIKRVRHLLQADKLRCNTRLLLIWISLLITSHQGNSPHLHCASAYNNSQCPGAAFSASVIKPSLKDGCVCAALCACTSYQTSWRCTAELSEDSGLSESI